MMREQIRQARLVIEIERVTQRKIRDRAVHGACIKVENPQTRRQRPRDNGLPGCRWPVDGNVAIGGHTGTSLSSPHVASAFTLRLTSSDGLPYFRSFGKKPPSFRSFV